MKKIFYAIALLCVSTFATETCYIADDPTFGRERRCTTSGYICEVGIDVGRRGGADAMYFFLGTTSTCERSAWFLTGDSQMMTYVFNDYIDANNKPQTDVSPSTATKFFLNSDNQYAGPLAMTVAGSFALSAYNHSNPVTVIYTYNKNINNKRFDKTTNQNLLVEHSGIRVLALVSNK
jgi:hypothetical protein